MNEVRNLAIAKGRPDMVRAIDQSLRYSERVEKVMPLLRRLEHTRGFRLIGSLCKRQLLRGAVI